MLTIFPKQMEYNYIQGQIPYSFPILNTIRLQNLRNPSTRRSQRTPTSN